MSTYTEAVAQCTEGLAHLSFGLCAACKDCQLNHGMTKRELDSALSDGRLSDEGGFSWSSCDVCGSPLGGTRYAAHAMLDGKIIHLSGCEDCLVYVSNGDEPAESIERQGDVP